MQRDAEEIETYRLIATGAGLSLGELVSSPERLTFIMDKRFNTLKSVLQGIKALEIACKNARLSDPDFAEIDE